MLTKEEELNKSIMELQDNIDLPFGFNVSDETSKIAIKAIEKQISKKVCIPPCNVCYKDECDCQCEYLGDTYRDAYRCPSCKSERVYMSEYDLKYDYCPDCGQCIKWEGVGEQCEV